VAGFIGSPSMNFFDAKMLEEGGKLKLDIGFTQVEVPDDQKDRYKEYVGKSVTFGLRPDDIHHPEYPPTGIKPSKVETEVDVIELMGNEKIVYLTNNGTTYLARMDPRSDVRVGLKTGALFNMANMHLFDEQTGLAL
jgi:multiple sugar transport system ATP-binding protein